jgi:lysophospholipid acyltransferase (LPLAT)-like uncharacterized protein
MSAASSPTPEARRRRPKAAGVVIPHRPKWHQRLLAWLIVACIRAVASTLRYRWEDPFGAFSGHPSGPAIYCFWHNRLALCIVPYWHYLRTGNVTPGMAALVSASKDGGLLSEVLECFGVEPVRGSSSRRGAQAILELTTLADRGYSVSITPDGPRGPCYEVQEGALSLAQLTGLPIVPYSCNLGWKIRVKSWDRFQIPLPFSRCEMLFAQPITVPREATDAEREELRRRLEASLRSITRD